MKIKKNIKKIIVGSIIVIICIIFVYPLSFDQYVRYKDKMEIGISNPQVVNGKTKIDMKTYKYQKDSKEFQEIVKILDKYKYHCYVKTFLGMTATDGGDEGYVLISLGNDMIVVSGSGEVLINKRLYHLGFGDNKKAVAMMKEIKSVTNP